MGFLSYKPLLLLLTVCSTSVFTQTVVLTSHGRVLGRDEITVTSSKPYTSFKGIPYAKPPIGDLRFEPPVTADRWTNVLNATVASSLCIESNRKTNEPLYSEDCLYLDIYKPNVDKRSLPTVVYIFGESFTTGQSLSSDAGPEFFLDQEVIYVTFRYRLGIFGFISTADDVAPGNNGLKDQVLALQWIQQNINRFGGTSSKLTIAGVGGGALSASLLQLSRRSAGLFSGVILESGSALSMWALSEKNQRVSKEVAKSLKITTASSYDMIEALKKTDAYTLQIEAYKQWEKNYNENPLDDIVFGPVIEQDSPTAFLTKSAYELLEKGEFSRVPAIIGYNSDEGNNEALSGYFMKACYLYDLYADLLIPKSVGVSGYFKRLSVGNKIKEKYFGVVPVCLQHQQKAKYFGDTEIVRPVSQTVKLQSNFAPVYFYKFSYSGNWSIKSSDGSVQNYDGAAHYEELPFIFYSKTYSPYECKDATIRTKVSKLWVNFIKTGNPTPVIDPVLESINWPKANTANDTIHYLDINANLQVKINPDEDIINFWADLFKNYSPGPLRTY